MGGRLIAAMFNPFLRLLVLVAGLLALVAVAQISVAQEPPVEGESQVEDAGTIVPAVEIVPEDPASEEPPWTFRYLIPTSLVIGALVVVGSIVAYFLKVVRTRYRVVQ